MRFHKSYVKDLYIKDLIGTLFVFKFDETTTLQVKKQYDGYIQRNKSCQ